MPFRASLFDDQNLAIVWDDNFFSDPGDTQTVPTTTVWNFPSARQMLLLHLQSTQTAKGGVPVVEKVSYTKTVKRENAGWLLCLWSTVDIS